MSIAEALRQHFRPEDDRLTDGEYEAVTDWIDREKDGLSGDLKAGLLKLLNGEMHRRMFKGFEDKEGQTT